MTAEMEPLDRTRQRLDEMAAELRHGAPGSYTLSVAERVPALLAEVERLTAALTEAQGAVILMYPVVEYVSMGRKHMTPATYPDSAARRALGALDDAFAASPQVREWLANTRPPVGEGKPDDMAELQRRMDELIPITVAGMRTDIAERDSTIAHLRTELDKVCSTFAEQRLACERHAAQVDNLSHALDVVQLREIRQNETIARLEAKVTTWKTRLVDETAQLRGHLDSARAERDDLTDRLIDAWHDGHGKDLTLHAYLGLTWEQYQQRFGPSPTATPAVPEKETTP